MQHRAIKMSYIKPGSPWENAYIESFHDKLRDEGLNREVFDSLAEARVVIVQWRREYNEYRPHSTLGYGTPAEAAARYFSKSALNGPHEDTNGLIALFESTVLREAEQTRGNEGFAP